jgi:hypothetical protein
MNLVKNISALILCLCVSACTEKTDNIPAFANPAAPEYRALTFFDAIYNNRDMALALKYVTPQHARVIKSYGSTKGYSRYVLNMQFDKGVQLKIDRSLSQVKAGTSDNTSVNVLFTGMYNNNKVNDLREVKFEKYKGQWYISKIGRDPYSRR